MTESIFENSTITGNNIKVGSAAYQKYFDVTTNKWERVKGSGSPQVIIGGVSGSTFLPIAVIYDAIDGNKLLVTEHPYLYDIAEGKIFLHQPFFKIGRNDDIDNIEEDFWILGGKYVYPTGSQMILSSSSVNDHMTGSGIQQVIIEYLNVNYLQFFETVQLSGSTQVPTVATNILRVNRLNAAAVGSNGSAIGNITIANMPGTPGYKRIPSGSTIDRALIYTVPTGSTLFIAEAHLSATSNATGHDVLFTLRSNYDTLQDKKISWLLPLFELDIQDTANDFDFKLPLKINGGCDIIMSVKSDAATANSRAYGELRGWFEQ